MNKMMMIAAIAVALSVGASANEERQKPGTLILQATSNLGCEELTLSLQNKATDVSGAIIFKSGAFSSVSLPEGTYTFGIASCVDGNRGTQTFKSLSETLKPISVKAGQTYFLGELVVQETLTQKGREETLVVDNCMSGSDRAAKSSSGGECRDGIGPSRKTKEIWTVDFYTPEMTDSDIQRVRAALSATPEQLPYMPLRAK
jgi:hypothetical protein